MFTNEFGVVLLICLRSLADSGIPKNNATDIHNEKTPQQ
jgi:hypothetical protein